MPRNQLPMAGGGEPSDSQSGVHSSATSSPSRLRIVTAQTAGVLSARIWLGLLFLWLAVKLFGADELRISTVEAPR